MKRPEPDTTLNEQYPALVDLLRVQEQELLVLIAAKTLNMSGTLSLGTQMFLHANQVMRWAEGRDAYVRKVSRRTNKA